MLKPALTFVEPGAILEARALSASEPPRVRIRPNALNGTMRSSGNSR